MNTNLGELDRSHAFTHDAHALQETTFSQGGGEAEAQGNSEPQ